MDEGMLGGRHGNEGMEGQRDSRTEGCRDRGMDGGMEEWRNGDSDGYKDKQGGRERWMQRWREGQTNAEMEEQREGCRGVGMQG